MKTNWMLAATLLLAATTALPLHAAEGVASPTTRTGAQADDDMTKEQLQAKARTLRQDITNAHFLGADVQEIEKRMTALSQRLEEMDLEMLEKRARLDAVTRKISELSKKAEITAGVDPIMVELVAIVEARMADADRLAKSGEAGSVQQRAEAAAAAAQARVNMEQRRETVMASVGGGILPELNKQLVELSLDVEVLETTRRGVANRLDDLNQIDDKAIELIHLSNLLAAKYKAGIDE